MVCKLSFFVLVFFLFATSSFAVVDVNTICKQAKDSSFCLNLLKSKPTTNPITLIEYTIGVARVNITNTIKLINSLIAKSAGNSDAKNHYKSCLIHFGADEGALGDISYTKELLKKRDYGGVNVAASAVLTDVDDCISGETPDDPPYPDHSPLPKYAATIELIVNIILVISKYLVK